MDKKDKLVECEKKKEEYLNGWKRSKADFENYKKDELKRVSSLIEYSQRVLLLELLNIVDDFEVAENQIPEEEKNEYIKGLLQIKSRLDEFLSKFGVEVISAVGKDFDPNFHEAVEMVDGEKSGVVVEEVSKGYIKSGKLIRPTKVKVIK